MTDRFDFEQRIMNCWSIVDDLDCVMELCQDNDKAMNALIGLKEIYTVKFNKMWESFENSLK